MPNLEGGALVNHFRHAHPSRQRQTRCLTMRVGSLNLGKPLVFPPPLAGGAASALFHPEVKRNFMYEQPERDSLQLPEDLPRVEPPSAGFIVQLFLVPGLIVLAIVGVWVGVNRLASSELDWRTLVADLQSPHEHLRWRGAYGLAQLLQADKTMTSSGTRLVSNPEVARQLADYLLSELKKNSQKPDDLQLQAFLARSLGLFHVPAEVLPALRAAMQPGCDIEVRKNALGAVAMLAGREAEAGEPLSDPALIDDILAASSDSDSALIRQMAAFDLGLLPGDKSRARLEVMLGDADANVEANAAIGLARQNSALGLPVLEKILLGADEKVEPKSEAEFHKFLLLKNCVAALRQLVPELKPAQKTELIELLEPVAKSFAEPRIRLDAEQVLAALQSRPAK